MVERAYGSCSGGIYACVLAGVDRGIGRARERVTIGRLRVARHEHLRRWIGLTVLAIAGRERGERGDEHREYEMALHGVPSLAFLPSTCGSAASGIESER